MASPKTSLTVLRSIALVGTVIIYVLGIWSLVVVQAIDNRGETVLASFQSRLGAEAVPWSQYITVAEQSNARTWISVVTNSIAALTMLLVIMSNRYHWLRIPPTIVILIELTSTISTIITFGCALSFALRLNAFNSPPFSTLDSADLTFFALLDPLSRALAITSALGSLLFVITFTANIIDYFQRHSRAKDTRSFEPTVSALGMSHGFHALHPQPRTTRPPIPTMYDPYKAFCKGPGRPSHIPGRSPNAKTVAFAIEEGAWISRKHSRWSASTASPSTTAPSGMARIEGDIMRLLEVKRARRGVPVRPARPWSGVYAI